MLPEFTAFMDPVHRAFTLQGGAPAAVLIHGFPGTPDEMRPLANHLNKAGWTVHVPLLPGFGAEINTLHQRTMEEWLQAVQTAVDHLRREHHASVLLVGHSMGGALAVMAAAQQEVDGLILLAPFYRIPHPAWEILPVIQVIIRQFKPFRLIKPDFNDPELRTGILNFMPGLDLDDPETQAAIKEFTVPISMINQIRKTGIHAYRSAPQVRAPVLVIQGCQDDLVRPAMTHELMKQFTVAPRYFEVDGSHDLIRADRPAWAQVAEAVTAFAGEIAPVKTDKVRMKLTS